MTFAKLLSVTATRQSKTERQTKTVKPHYCSRCTDRRSSAQSSCWTLRLPAVFGSLVAAATLARSSSRRARLSLSSRFSRARRRHWDTTRCASCRRFRRRLWSTSTISISAPVTTPNASSTNTPAAHDGTSIHWRYTLRNNLLN